MRAKEKLKAILLGEKYLLESDVHLEDFQKTEKTSSPRYISLRRNHLLVNVLVGNSITLIQNIV